VDFIARLGLLTLDLAVPCSSEEWRIKRVLQKTKLVRWNIPMPQIPPKKRIVPTTRPKQDFEQTCPNLLIQSNRFLHVQRHLDQDPGLGIPTTRESAVETDESAMTENVPVERGIIDTKTTSVVALGVVVEPIIPETAVLVEAVVEKTKGRIIVRVMRRDEGDANAAELEIEVRPPEEQVPKKKKEYKATSSFIGDDEFEDILERGWFYVDSNDDKQGPFTTKEMKEWYVAGFFNNELLVKRVADPNFQKISDREEFKQLERKPSAQTYAPLTTFEQQQTLEQETAQNPYYQDFPAVYDPSFEQEASAQDIPNDADPSNYVQAAFFTTLKGRFSAGDQATHWKKKGLPTDKDGRMLSHYFDVEAYQEQMRNCDPPKKKKVTKNMIKYYKKRKEDRKRRRALML